MSSQAANEPEPDRIFPLWFGGSGPESDGLTLPTLIATRDIAPCGDVLLELPSSAGIVRMKVASQVLCSISSVFRAMLGPTSPFKEACELRTMATNAEPYRLQLEDDNPEALGIILLVLHHQNALVPKSVSFQNLLDLAIVCDKYDCAAVVSLWIDMWSKDWKGVALEPGYEQWLFISWTFGMAEVFESLSKKLIMEGHYGTDDPTLFVTTEGFCLDEMLVPECIMAKIREQRETIIYAISEAALYYQGQYMKPWGKPICKATTKSETCDATILGSIMKGFHSIGLTPDPQNFLLKSVKDAEKSITGLRIEFMANVGGGICNYCDHAMGSNGYCSYCGRTHSSQQGVTHQTTCTFLPELCKKVSTAVAGGIKLTLSDFKTSKEKSPEAEVAKWEIFEYK